MDPNKRGLAPLAFAADHAIRAWGGARSLHPRASAEALRARFCTPLPEEPQADIAVLSDLIEAAEPGLVGNTEAEFYAWVMGGSSPVGVAADWLTAAWGQNAAIYQTSPAAAVAEEAVAGWLLDLLDLPRAASVGLVTGATMAGFVCLAAARTAVLTRAGHDFERDGFQGAPAIRAFLSDEAHVSNHAALRYLGLGDGACIRIPSDDEGRMNIDALARAMSAHGGPSVVITQAGQINTGAFEDFRRIATVARRHGAWLHVDGAFGLWARAAPSAAPLADGSELADSWSVDGHKWLQIPYDGGFAIVRDAEAHRLAMDISASYLTASPEDGRNPTHYNPELSRRARGFAAWAVLRSLGRAGIADLVERHCACARDLAKGIGSIDGLRVLNDVGLNQVLVGPEAGHPPGAMAALAARLNADGPFVRTTWWKGEEVLRLSLIGARTGAGDAARLADAVARCWRSIDDRGAD